VLPTTLSDPDHHKSLIMLRYWVPSVSDNISVTVQDRDIDAIVCGLSDAVANTLE